MAILQNPLGIEAQTGVWYAVWSRLVILGINRISPVRLFRVISVEANQLVFNCGVPVLDTFDTALHVLCRPREHGSIFNPSDANKVKRTRLIAIVARVESPRRKSESQSAVARIFAQEPSLSLCLCSTA
jgi:hypothetical protein